MEKYGCSEDAIAHYTCFQVVEPIIIDGNLNKPIWQDATSSPRFVDMASGDPGWYDTRAAALWDKDYLYIGFWIEEPYVEARLRERDDIIFRENEDQFQSQFRFRDNYIDNELVGEGF